MSLVIESLGWTLLHSLWEGTLIWLALRATLAVLAYRSAKARYAVSCAALALVVFAFWATFLRVELAGQHAVVAAPLTVVSTSVTLGPEKGSRDRPPGESSSFQATNLSLACVAVLPWVVVSWLAGCSWASVKMVADWRAAKRLVRTSHLPTSAWLEVRCKELARQLGIERVVQIAESILVDGPSVVGWLKPVILVPIGAFSGLEPAQVDGLLAHELAHILRHDFAINVLQSVCEVLFFYHPAIRAISQEIRFEREQACDDIAVKLTGDPDGYAAALTKLEETRCPALVLAANGGGGLLTRVRRLLVTPAAPKRGLIANSWMTFAGLALALAALFVAPGVTIRLLAAEPNSATRVGSVGPATGKQIETEFPYAIDFATDSPEWGKFFPGDDIVITAVRGDRNHIEPGGRYLVEGTFRLSSMESAGLELSVTASSPFATGAMILGQWTLISRGTGSFSLRAAMRYPGRYHISFTPPPGGESHGTVYFYEKASTSPVAGGETYYKVVDINAEGLFGIESAGQLADISDYLRKYASESTPPAIRIVAAPNAPFSSVVELLKELKQANLKKFTFTQLEPDSDMVTIELSGKDTCYWNKELISIKEIETRFKEYQKLVPYPHVEFIVRTKADFHAAQKIADQALNSGIQRVSMRSEPPQGSDQ